MIGNFEQLLDKAHRVRGKRVVVIFPNSEETFSAVQDALEKNLATFILVGDEKLIQKQFSPNTPYVEVVNVRDLLEALTTSIELVRKGKGDILMKGGIDTSTIMKAVLQESAGIRTRRLRCRNRTCSRERHAKSCCSLCSGICRAESPIHTRCRCAFQNE